jgi:hypothetical protein
LSLNHQSQIVAEAQIGSLTGHDGIGVYLLSFSVLLSIPAWHGPHPCAVLRNLRAKVFVGGEQGPKKFLGVSFPEAVLTFRQASYAQQERFLLDLVLSPEQLSSLEEIRAGGGLRFELVFQGETEGEYGTLRADETVIWNANLSVWSAVLGQLNLTDIVVIGVELPRPSAAGVGRTAFDTLRRAKQDLIAGDYQSVVSRCRIALESIKNELGDVEKTAASLDQFVRQRRSMSKKERQLVLTEALRHYTHPAHHVDDDGQQEWYSRADATFVLSITAATIATELKESDLSAQRELAAYTNPRG